jgi:hypothetical protein
MPRSTEAASQAAKVAELKQFITSNRFESLEKLEEAVDALLWADDENETSEACGMETSQR